MACSVCKHRKGFNHNCLVHEVHEGPNAVPWVLEDVAQWLLDASRIELPGTSGFFSVVWFVADALLALDNGTKPNADIDIIEAALRCVDAEKFNIVGALLEGESPLEAAVACNQDAWKSTQCEPSELRTQFPDVFDLLELAAACVTNSIDYFRNEVYNDYLEALGIRDCHPDESHV